MESLKDKVNKTIDEFCDGNDVIKYSISGGKRLRPIICLEIANNFDKNDSRINQLALAIELIHNSSLIIDDLPCMDNDDYRRGIMTTHKKYGEGVAVQCAMKLIAESCSRITSLFLDKHESFLIVNNVINENLGINGLPYGQYVDIKQIKLNNIKNYKELIYKKTTTLFNLCFILPFLYFSNDETKLQHIKKASKWFGLLFQIYDDFDDIEQDKKNNNPNIVLYLGLDKSNMLFKKAINKCKLHLLAAGITDYPAITEIINIIQKKVDHILAY